MAVLSTLQLLLVVLRAAGGLLTGLHAILGLSVRRLLAVLGYRRLLAVLGYRRLLAVLGYHRLLAVLGYRRLLAVGGGCRLLLTRLHGTLRLGLAVLGQLRCAG